MELQQIKGFGPKRIELLKQLHIETCEDLLGYYPSEYRNDAEPCAIVDAPDGENVTLCVRIVSDGKIFFNKGKTIVSQRAVDDSGSIVIRWMNQPYRMNQYGIGTVLYLYGKVTRKRGTYIYNPRIEQQQQGIVPIYDLPKGLTQSGFRQAVEQAMHACRIVETLPEELTAQYDLLPRGEALREIHFPTGTEALYRARYRIQFETAFLYFLAVASFRERANVQNGFAYATDGIRERFLAMLPYTPTGAQLRVLGEVEADMRSGTPMNRLIQGDVGSGKTVIAAYAMLIAEQAGRQGVFLVPTEILAEQHFQKLNALFFGRVALYTGSLSEREKRALQGKIAYGEVQMIVGTHALLTDRVEFFDLGLVVTDEQHRFGVAQRAKIESKGIRPDVLVMSATPIPRTLALLLYSDLALSVIDELPKGRTPIKTYFVPLAKRVSMYRHIGSTVIKEHQRAYVVCPLIEPTDGFETLSAEEVYAELRALLPACVIGLLHGRMKEAEKTDVMNRFRSGAIQILVSTTVVEVGVDVPEATHMVIEGSDHFGLATLHQLRGRVGRGTVPSSCYLLAKKPSEHAKQRIQMMLASNDGFALAQKDMEMRGYGDLFGVQQSGEGMLSRILSEFNASLLERSAAAAKEVYETPTLRNNELIREAAERYGKASAVARN